MPVAEQQAQYTRLRWRMDFLPPTGLGFADPEDGLAVGIAMATAQGGASVPAARREIAVRVREALGVPPLSAP